MNFIHTLVLCLGIVITSYCPAMETLRTAPINRSGASLRGHLQDKINLLEATLGELVEDQASQSEIETVQRGLARAHKDLEESRGVVLLEETEDQEKPLVTVLARSQTRQNNLVSTIDVNEGQSLEAFVGPEPGIIGLFGGTPRYSCFEDYRKTFQECSSGLLSQYDKTVMRAKCSKPPQRLKGVERRIRKVLARLREHPGLPLFKDALTFSEIEMTDLFFAAGFDHELLAKNIETLLSVARQSRIESTGASETLCHIHVFVPSYFTDLPHFRTMDDAPQKLHAFLKKAAVHYQGLYERASACPDLKICILIPPIDYFIKAMKSDADDKLIINGTLVLKEVTQVVNPTTRFLLFDQDFDQDKIRQAMVSFFQKEGVAHVVGKAIPLRSPSGLAIHTFNPYVLVPKKNKSDGNTNKHDYKTSPLFNSYLVKFFQERYEGGAHE